MSDNFGSGQNRVLTVLDRNLDNVVFQYKVPPLTSEWNLINQIGNEKVQNLSKVSLPSGWLSVGGIYQDLSESNSQTGQVLCSDSYSLNSFKLISRGDNIAIVNGWPLLIQETDDNKVIFLETSTGQFYDFIFLEVWRKLVPADGTIYKYGNVDVDGTPYGPPQNEIEWDTINTETTKRVQIQYRIRHVNLSSIVSSPINEIFDIISVHPKAGATSEISTYSYHCYGPSDPGLYIAGTGTSSQETLNTVDGYSYAIPMFLIYRRVKSDSLFNYSQMRRTFVDSSMSTTGYVSDRPDGKLSDIIYKDDIIDMRHRIIASGNDAEDIMKKSMSKILSGDLSTSVKLGFGEDGSISSNSSGGNILLKSERICSDGSDIGETDFKRRSFCNAEVTLDHNIVKIENPNPTWQAGTIIISSVVDLPDGEIESVDGFYSNDAATRVVTGITSDTTTINIVPDSSLIGTSDTLLMEFTFKYDSSSEGFYDVPKEFMEVNKNDTLPIATRDSNVPIRFNDKGKLINFGTSVGDHAPWDETTTSDFIRYRGGNYTENTNFGHEIVVYRTTNDSASASVTLDMDDNSKYNGYYILGIKSVELASNPGTFVDFTVNRSIKTPPYKIDYYTVTVTGYLNTEVIITCYTGSKFLEDYTDTYSVSDSFKFFELSKQGRGVIDCYEMIEAIALEVSSGVYEINTYENGMSNKPIISIATKGVTASDAYGTFVQGVPFAFEYNISGNAIPLNIGGSPEINRSLPVLDNSSYAEDFLPTIIQVNATSGKGRIRIPILVHSFITKSESPYNFYYKTIPYQGLLRSSSSVYGKITSEGPGIITTLGSGSVNNINYTGTATFTQDTRSVIGSNNYWTRYTESGDFIRVSGNNKLYRIISVSNNQLILAESFVESTEIDASYEIIRIDIPSSINSNVIDRLPSLKIVSSSSEYITDYTCYSDTLDSLSNLIMKSPSHKIQDPLVSIPNDFILGSSTTAKRGRNNVKFTNGMNDLYKIGEGRAYIKYESTSGTTSPRNKKVFQFYLFNRSGKDYYGITGNPDLTGKLYLMVISGETINDTNNTINPYLYRDTVDIFELEGRPIIKG